MEYIKNTIEQLRLTELNNIARIKALGTPRHIGNEPLSKEEVHRIISLVKKDLKNSGFTFSGHATAYASTLKRASSLRDGGPARIHQFFMEWNSPVAETIRVVSAFGWEQEDIGAEKKGFGNALFIGLALLALRDWERYHGHDVAFELRYADWLGHLFGDEFAPGVSIAIHAHFGFGFSLLAEMRGKNPLPWSFDSKGGQI